MDGCFERPQEKGEIMDRVRLIMLFGFLAPKDSVKTFKLFGFLTIDLELT